jgi:hypothetical protein
MFLKRMTCPKQKPVTDPAGWITEKGTVIIGNDSSMPITVQEKPLL